MGLMVAEDTDIGGVGSDTVITFIHCCVEHLDMSTSLSILGGGSILGTGHNDILILHLVLDDILILHLVLDTMLQINNVLTFQQGSLLFPKVEFFIKGDI